METLQAVKEEFYINEIKPGGSESLDSAAAKCRELSDLARSNSTKTLVIAFEGLASYDGSGTREACRYHYRLANHQRPGEAPRRGLGGFVLHGLMVPMVQRHRGGIEFLVLPHSSISGSGSSVAETCARIWKANPRNESDLRGCRLVIVGHSYGGHAAVNLAQALNRGTRVSVDAVLTLDPHTRMYMGSLERPANVGRWENYVHSGIPSLPGYKVDGADVNSSIGGTSHTSLPWAPAAHDTANRLFSGR